MKFSLTISIFFSALFVKAQSLDIPLITVQGSAVVFANPDEVLLSFVVFKKGQDLAEARTAYQIQSKEVISFLKSQGISDQHIQTQYATTGPKRKRNSNDIEYYFSRQNINVCIRDLSKFDNVLNGLVGLDVYELGSVSFRAENIVEKRQEALRLAIRDAKQKAEMLVNEIGQTIGKAKLINEIQNRSTSHNAEGYGSSTIASSGISVGNTQGFAPGQLEIKSIVNVSFELP